MKILALDQALKTTGYAIFDNKKPIEWGIFSIPANLSMEKRLLEIIQYINELYSIHEFSRLFLEDIQLQAGNVITYKHLAYVQATILLWCSFNNIEYQILAPSHWRKILGGNFGRKREEQKKHAIELIKDWYDIDVSSDEADAICIARAALQENKQSKVAFDDTKNF